MEEHYLKPVVEGEAQFKPEPWYNPYGDCVVCRAAEEAVVAERVDPFLTIYRSAEDNRVTGFQVKDVRAIMDKLGANVLAIQAESPRDAIVSLRVLLLAALRVSEQSPSREMFQAYDEVITKVCQGEDEAVRVPVTTDH